MQLENEEEVKDVVEETPADTSAEETPSDDGVNEDVLVVDDREAAAEAPPEYVPNRKFKVLDEEKEIDEWLTPALNKETEPKIRELYEKAFALEHVKKGRDEIRLQHQETQSQLEGVKQYFADLQKLANTDMEAFFEEINIPKQHIAKWLLANLEAEEKLKDLPPHLQQVYNEHGALKRSFANLEKKLQMTESASVNHGVQARTNELQGVLSRPDITPLVQEFDTRLGKPGAFFEQVVRHGRAEWEIHKKDVSVEEAVNQVLQLFALKPASQAPSQGVKPNAQQAGAPKVIKQPKATVIPNVTASPASPAAQKPKSLDDIRKMAKEMAAS